MVIDLLAVTAASVKSHLRVSDLSIGIGSQLVFSDGKISDMMAERFITCHITGQFIPFLTGHEHFSPYYRPSGILSQVFA